MYLFCSVSFPKENGLPADTLQITTQRKSCQQLHKLLFRSTEDVHSNSHLHVPTCPDICARRTKFWPHLWKLLRTVSLSITSANAPDLLVVGFFCLFVIVVVFVSVCGLFVWIFVSLFVFLFPALPEHLTEHSHLPEVLECHWHNSSTRKAMLAQKGWQYRMYTMGSFYRFLFLKATS